MFTSVRALGCALAFTAHSGESGGAEPTQIRGSLDRWRLIHDMRYTFSTTLLQSGIDLYKVQGLFG
ncbi:MAG TPA: hypothetical protein PK866_01085 [Nitrospira sp.]|nr:hypothetical protein [Nitrospira sp.]